MFTAGLLGAIVAVLVAAALLLSATVASHRARSAADLSALAAAAARPPACAEARRVAARQGAEVRACTVEGDDVEVTVAVLPAGAAGRFGEALARARAGPERGPARGRQEVGLSGGDRTGR